MAGAVYPDRWMPDNLRLLVPRVQAHRGLVNGCRRWLLVHNVVLRLVDL